MKVVVTGKLHKVHLNGRTIEEVVGDDTENFVIVDGQLYEYHDVEETPINDFVKATTNDSGVIEFMIGFDESGGNYKDFSGEIVEVAGYSQ